MPHLGGFCRYALGVWKLIISVILAHVCLFSFFSQSGYRIPSETIAADGNLGRRHRSPFLIGFPRTMWASGYHARSHPDLDFSANDACGVWTWTAETEDAFASHYRNTMFGGRCDSKGSIFIGDATWGHASRLRDVAGFLLEGVLSNRQVRHAGPQVCPNNPEADPMLWCQFSKISSCKNIHGQGEAVDTNFEKNVGWFTGIPNQKNANHAPVTYKPGAELWQKLVQNGLKNIVQDQSKCDRKRASMDSASRRLGILRTLLLATSLLPTAELEFERDALGERLSPPSGAMLVIHIRRTDKGKDGAKLKRHETKSDPTESIAAVKELIKIAERVSGKLFESFFVMSDDPVYYSANVSKALSSAGSRSPKVLFDDSVPKYLESVLPRNNSYRNQGHSSLSGRHREWLTRQMFAGVYFAGKRGAFVIGNGKSGVTQLVAQLVGARQKVDPNAVALFEDDPVQLGAFKETQNFTI